MLGRGSGGTAYLVEGDDGARSVLKIMPSGEKSFETEALVLKAVRGVVGL